jgi:hypothetical protein
MLISAHGLKRALVAGRLLSPCNQVPTTHQSTNDIKEHIVMLLLHCLVCISYIYKPQCVYFV